MDEQNQDSNSLFYGEGAGTSGGEISDADLALLQKSNAKGVEVRDGDDNVNVDLEGEEPKDNTEENHEETPEDKPEDKAKDKPDATLDEQITESQNELAAIGEDLKAKGVDVEAVLKNFTENGKFSDDDYKNLEKAGYPKAAVNAIVKGQQALAQEATRALFASVGGEENFTALSDYAVANDPAAVEVFNDAQMRGDVKAAQVILKAIERSYRAQYGTVNKQISGTPKGARQEPAQVGFQTKAEMVKAMSDRRYGQDPEYTRQVEMKVAKAAF